MTSKRVSLYAGAKLFEESEDESESDESESDESESDESESDESELESDEGEESELESDEGEDGPLDSASFTCPSGLATLGRCLYVADDQRVRKVGMVNVHVLYARLRLEVCNQVLNETVSLMTMTTIGM